MVEKFSNDWLRDVIEESRKRGLPPQGSSFSGSEALLDRIYSLTPSDFEPLVRPIQDFQGTKLLISCTDRTPLENTLKQALCFADLVIIVPAPLWASCGYMGSVRYAEFNFESIELAGCWNVAVGLVNNLSGLLVGGCEAFDDGAVTFLPMVGESLHRWSHPELVLPELPEPYSGQQGRYTSMDAHMEAFYALCIERMAAERLGAIHLNTASFTRPVFGDFTIGERTTRGQPVRSLVEIGVPDFSVLSLGEVLRFRRELSDERSHLSRAIASVLRPQDEYRQGMQLAIENVRSSCARLIRHVESILPPGSYGKSARVSETMFALGSGGPNGGTMRAVDFLLDGGTLRDLLQLLTSTDEAQLEIREDSMLAADFIGK